MKNKVFLGVVFFYLIFGIISCGKEPQNIEINFWTTETQAERQAVIQAIADTFNIINPEITVNIVPIDENDLQSQIEVIINGGGTLPDIAEIPSGVVVAFGTQDIIDTNAVQEIISAYDQESFFKGALDLVSSSDGTKYYGVPYHGWIQGIWYRQDWFDEAGLEKPSRWRDILKAAEYFYKPSDNQYGILVGTKPEAYAEQVYTPFALSNNAPLFDAQGNLIFNSDQTKETLEYYKKLAQYTPPGPQTWRARDYYLQGKLAMFFYSTYIMDDLALQDVATGSLTSENFEDLSGGSFDAQLAKNTGFAPIITNSDDAGYGTLVTISILKNENEDRKKAAIMFADFLMEKENYITFLHMAPGGMLPMREGITDMPEFLNDPKGIYEKYGKESLDEIIAGFKSIKTFNIVNGRQIEAANVIFSKQVIPQMIYQITQENKNIDEAIAEAEMEMKKIISEM